MWFESRPNTLGDSVSYWKPSECTQCESSIFEIAGIYAAPWPPKLEIIPDPGARWPPTSTVLLCSRDVQARTPAPSAAQLPPKPAASPNLLRGTWKMGEKMGQNLIFHWDFLYLNFKILSTNFNLREFLAKSRKNAGLAFLIYFSIVKDFQTSIRFALPFINISFFKS